MTSTTISDTGAVIAASRLIRRTVWGHSVIAIRIVVPSSLARLTFPSPSCASVVPVGAHLGAHGIGVATVAPVLSCWADGQRAITVQCPAVALVVGSSWHSRRWEADNRECFAMRMTTPLEPALPAGADPFMRRQGIQQIRDKVQDCGKAALCPQAGISPIEAFHSTPH
jgi:hypothetical protein